MVYLISPSPPKCHRIFDRITVDFFYARKLHKIKIFPFQLHRKQPLRSIFTAVFLHFAGVTEFCSCENAENRKIPLVLGQRDFSAISGAVAEHLIHHNAGEDESERQRRNDAVRDPTAYPT